MKFQAFHKNSLFTLVEDIERFKQEIWLENNYRIIDVKYGVTGSNYVESHHYAIVMYSA